MSTVVLENVSLSFGARPILEELSLRVAEGDRIGLIGPNGSGKSTLLRILAGDQQPDSGTVRTARGVRIGWLPQDIAVAGGQGLLAFVMKSVPGRAALEADLAAAEALVESLAAKEDHDEIVGASERLADLHAELARFDAHYSEHEALKILAGLGFKTEDGTRDLGELSGGWKMRAVLAALLFSRPDVLLLDEPTNHLDMPSVAWFADFLKGYSRAFVLISHDREFLNEQIARVVTFEVEGVRQYPGNYERYLVQRAEEEEILENKAKNLEREREKAEQFINRFRAQATKARAVQSRIKALDKMEHAETYRKRRTMAFSFPEVARAGHEIVRIDGVSKSYGERRVLSEVTLRAYRDERIGIIGPNGAGKTTLLKMIAGEIEASGGAITLGHSVTPGYYAQHHADLLTPKNTVLNEVSAENREVGQTRVRSVLGAFLFSGDDVDKTIQVLSGGERARVALAKLLVRPGNLLLLDEPTNHLDLDSCESLVESLSGFGGTMIFVSHNRALIRRLATKIWVVEGGTVTEYMGSLDDYMARERARLVQAAKDATATTTSKSVAPPKAEPAPSKKAPAAAAAPAPTPAPVDEKQRRREEAQKREQRNKVIAPLKKKVEELELRIAEIETKQAERNAKLCDPAASLTDKERFALLDGLQVDQGKLDELTERWEHVQKELDEKEKALA
ncbi:MAG: ABC-F family ATP-binding cassette domain-containing protein [Sandaracinus sp.]